MSANNDTGPQDAETSTQRSEVHHVQTEGTAMQTLERGARHHVIEQLHASQDAPSRQIETVTFPFSRGTGNRGVTKSAIAGVLTLISLFLLAESAAMPTLTTKIYMLSTLGLISAAILAVLAVRDMFGALTISKDGISMTPSAMGFAVPWTSLRSWCIRIDGGPAMTLKLYDDLPRQLPAGLLSEKQLSDVWQILRSQAISKEAG